MTTTATSTTSPTAIELARALQSGAATIVPAETELDTLNCNTMQDSGAWPETTLEITMGEWHHSLPVWYVASWVRGAHPSLRPGDWDVSVSDGQFRGFRQPTVGGDEDDNTWTVEIPGGDNMGGDLSLDAASESEAEQACEIIEGKLQAAYHSISVPEPTDEALIEYLSSGQDETYVSVDENGEYTDLYRIDSELAVTIYTSKRRVMGKRLYAIRSTSEERKDAEERVYDDAEQVAIEARDLLANLLGEAADKVRAAKPIMPPRDDE